jgi:ankyrin repeat protein
METLSIFEATIKGDVLAVTSALRPQTKELRRDKEGNTALHLAVRVGNEKLVRLLLHHGAHPNARNNRRETPVHEAARLNSPATLAILLSEGGNPLVRATDGLSPLDIAVVCSCAESVDFLIKHVPASECRLALRAITQKKDSELLAKFE